MDILKAAAISGRCYNQEDGAKLFKEITLRLRKNESVMISFEGIETVPSSFVNASLIALLDEYTFNEIKHLVKFTKTTRQINEMIRSRFIYEAETRKAK